MATLLASSGLAWVMAGVLCHCQKISFESWLYRLLTLTLRMSSGFLSLSFLIWRLKTVSAVSQDG